MVDEATELLEQFAPTMESDSQTSQEVDWPSLGDESVNFKVLHQAFWPVKDIIVDEDTNRLRWEIRQDAQNIADDTLYPNPRSSSASISPASRGRRRTLLVSSGLSRGTRYNRTLLLRVRLWD